MLKQANYPAAEEALKSFVVQHPKDALAASAQYWLGETYYRRGRYGEAAGAFAEGYKRYPKGSKAPDDLLKLGMSLARANQKQNACVAFAQLDHDFPHPGSAIKETGDHREKAAGLLTNEPAARPLTYGEFAASLASLARFETSTPSRRGGVRRRRQSCSRHSGGPLGAREGGKSAR